MVSPDHVSTPIKKTDFREEEGAENKQQELSLIQGIRDYSNFPIGNEDYYGQLGSLGFYNPDHYPRLEPLTHDISTTTALHMYDLVKKKTPIDRRVDVATTDLGRVARDYKNSDLYAIQDWATADIERIREKTHRIQSDPSRKLQSQSLIEISEARVKISKAAKLKKIPPLNQMIAYNQMLLNLTTMLLERTTDVLDYQEKIFTFNKYELKPLARNFYAELTLVDGAEATKFDFRDENNNKNIPSVNTILDFPKHNLLSLNIIFDSGTNIHFATNKSTNSLETTVKLTNAPETYTITPGQFSIESLNIRASGANGTVRLIGLY
jgi:hypothetical protein